MNTEARHGRRGPHHGGPSREDAHRSTRGRGKGFEAIAEKLAARFADRHHGHSHRGRPGGGHGDGSSGGMRRQRMFDGGELRLVLLKLIADEPRHGYELIKSVEDLTGGGYAPSPGTIYPTLTMLNELGHVASEDTGNGRKKFTITPDGAAYLAEHAEAADTLIGKLSAMGEEHKRTNGAPVRRAMGNLKVALQGRLSRGDASDAMLLDAAALIDEVAQKIERL
jgi:DNA-binding PadR family transcriptional regulator